MKATFVPQPGLTPPDARERAAREGHMRAQVAQLHSLEDRLRQGGGAERIAKQHKSGKLTARERIAKLIDPGSTFLELGLLVAFDRYDGNAPAAGVVTGPGTRPRTPGRDHGQ